MASLVPRWWPKWSKRTWLAAAACALVTGALIGSQWGTVRVSDGAHFSVFIGAGRLGFETYMHGAKELELTPPAGVTCWYFGDDPDAVWPDTQNTRDWVTSNNTLSWLNFTTVRFWPLEPISVGLLAWALVRERRRARERAGACVGCGYSLAGLTADAPCPECGRAR